MTYKIYLEKGGKKIFDEVDVGRADGDPAIVCGCGGRGFAHTMVDVRSFRRNLTGGAKFICDGCISKWERQRRAIDPQDNFLVRHEFRAKFAEKRLGKKDTQAEIVKGEYLKKEQKRIIEDAGFYVDAPDDHPDKIKLATARIEIEKRLKDQPPVL